MGLYPTARMDETFLYVWSWKKRLPERKGQRCRLLAAGALNSVALAFDNGFRVITDRRGIRRIKDCPSARIAER